MQIWNNTFRDTTIKVSNSMTQTNRNLQLPLLQLLFQGSFQQEKVNQPHHRDTQRPCPFARTVYSPWQELFKKVQPATSPSRLGSVLRRTWRGVHLDLKMSKVSLWGKDQWEGIKHTRERGFNPVLKVTRLSILCERLTST